MRNMHRVFAACIALVLAISSCVMPIVASEADESTILITSTEDFLEFAKLCTYDGYSQGKSVLLQTDLDLSDTGFEDIPIFLGTFFGGGHTIRGLNMDLNKDGQGLFRRISEGATVSNLHLAGNSATQYSTIGGVAAENYGTIQGCSYSGIISGLDSVGGIAGKNYGAILNCTNNGGVFGETNVGGLVGINYGTVETSINNAKVNTDLNNFQSAFQSTSLLDVAILDVTNTEETVTNVGGIIGDNQGTVLSSTNNGSVGYPHVGYNVGGIAGKHSGYLDGCTNSASIQGRRDVGGVVGQFDPYIQQDLSNSKLQDLRDEMDVLSELTTNLSSQAKNSNSAVSDQIESLLDAVDLSKDYADSLLNQSQDLVNANLDVLNDISGRISDAMEHLEIIMDSTDAITDELSNAMEFFEGASDNLGDAFRELEDLEDISEEIQDDLQDAENNWNKALAYLQLATSQVTDFDGFIDDFNTGNLSLDDISNTLASISSDLTMAIVHFRNATDSLSDVVAQMDDITNVLSDANQQAQAATDDLSDAFEAAGSMVDNLEETTGLIDDLIDDLNSREEIAFVKTDEAFDQTKEELSTSLDLMGDNLDGLNQVTSDNADYLVDDIQAVADQFSVVTDKIVEILEDVSSFDEEELLSIEDASLQEEPFTMGTLQNSINRGTIQGDSNVGGLVGNVSFELNQDFLDRLEAGEDKTQSVSRAGVAIIANGTNLGDVTAKKDNVGGIVGFQDYGLVTDSLAAAHIDTEEGSYIGGIAGQSTTYIRNSYAKTTLSGSQFVGGIAGAGYDIQNCYALTAATATDGALGGIVGQLDDEGCLVNNYFVGDTLGGLDGISYAGQAQSLTYEELLQVAGLPDVFRSMILRFFVDDALFAAKTVEYGDSLTLADYPEAPEKAGYFCNWEQVDFTNIVSDLQIYGTYQTMLTTLSGEKDNGAIATILVDGHFTDKEALVVTTIDSDDVGEYAIYVEGTHTEMTAIRYLAPEASVQIQLLQDGNWVNIASELDGKYLYIPLPEGTTYVQFRAVALLIEKQHTKFVLIFLGILSILAAIALFRKSQKKKAMTPVATIQDNDTDS